MSKINGHADVADALRDTLQSGSLCNASADPANVVDAVHDGLHAVARALDRLGNADASTPMGGLEGLGDCVLKGSEAIAVALSEVSSALRNIADRQRRLVLDLPGRSPQLGRISGAVRLQTVRLLSLFRTRTRLHRLTIPLKIDPQNQESAGDTPPKICEPRRAAGGVTCRCVCFRDHTTTAY